MAPACANDRSATSGTQPAPGFFPTSVSPTSLSGQIRNRRRFAAEGGIGPRISSGGRWNRNDTSVAVTGMHFPALMTIGTSAHRHESTASRTATKDSVVESGATPATSR